MAGRSGFGNENLNFLRIFQVCGFLPIPLKNDPVHRLLVYSGFGVFGVLVVLSLLRYFLVPDTKPMMDVLFNINISIIVFVIVVAVIKQNKHRSVLR